AAWVSTASAAAGWPFDGACPAGGAGRGTSKPSKDPCEAPVDPDGPDTADDADDSFVSMVSCDSSFTGCPAPLGSMSPLRSASR
ncbi:MAG: hypothetical protein JWP82_3026, partial [Humibacillus sp.]|nr:hypothetical protein [Humibacillus sp.]